MSWPPSDCPPGKVRIVWFNSYSGVVLRTPSKIIVIDPVEVRADDISAADVVLITHEHYDHYEASIVSKIYERTGVTVVGTPPVASDLRGSIPSNKLLTILPGSKLELGRVTVFAEQSRHPARQPVTLAIRSDDGLMVYHSSDSQPFYGMKDIGVKYRPDVGLFPVGIAPGCSPSTAVESALMIKPKVAIPYHGTGLKDFAQRLMAKTTEIKAVVINKNQVYTYP